MIPQELERDDFLGRFASAFMGDERPETDDVLFGTPIGQEVSLDEEPNPDAVSLWDNVDWWTDEAKGGPPPVPVLVTNKDRRLGRKTFQQSTPGSSGAFQAAEAATARSQLTTGELADQALTFKGHPYEWGFTGQKDPAGNDPVRFPHKSAFDCSGLINSIMTNAGFTNFPRTSGEIYAHSKHISVAKAIKTRGAVLWHEGHIAISLGNGKTIEAMGEDYGVVIGDAHGRFTGGGILPELTIGKGRIERHRQASMQTLKAPSKTEHELGNHDLTDPVPLSDAYTFTGALLSLSQAEPVRTGRFRKKTKADLPDNSGPKADIKAQLYQGFLDAGRKDLAKMVYTKAFDTWIGAETAGTWDPTIVGPGLGSNKRVGGLFQFMWFPERNWLHGAFNGSATGGGNFDMGVRKQAYYAGTMFGLTPEDIEKYAQQIRQGQYQGWG